MSLPLPELAGLEPCRDCGHPRTHHNRAGCAADLRDHSKSLHADAIYCPCSAYHQDPDTMTSPTLADAITEICTPLDADIALAMTSDQLRELGNQLAPGRAIITLPKLHDRTAKCDPAIVWEDDDERATILEGEQGILTHVDGPLTVLDTIHLAAGLIAVAIRRAAADS